MKGDSCMWWRLAPAIFLALAACETTGFGPAPSRVSLRVSGEAVNIVAPAGFCVDSESTSVDANGAFVLLGDCQLFNPAGPTRGNVVGAALTASISSGGLGGENDAPVQTIADLKQFVGTREGRALLGRSGDSQNVSILSTTERDGVFYVHVEDRGTQPVAGVEPQFWRAFLELGDRFVVLSVLEFQGAGVSSQESLNLIASLATSLKRSNGG